MKEGGPSGSLFFRMHFDEHYRERATLRDGTPVELRMVRPEDKELLRRGFEQLSPHTRYLRFHGVKTELSEAELRYLTEVDGVQHLAIGAVRGEGEAQEGLGIARLVALPGEPGVAEAAITVADPAQGQGLGTLLFQRLVAAAGERGIRRIRCFVLGSNQPMQELIRRLGGGETDVRVDAGVMTIELALPAVAADASTEEAPRESGLYELLRMAARRILELRG
jgi:GNAT superfamily N-acetyltransferase